jgi:hypothetical protein
LDDTNAPIEIEEIFRSAGFAIIDPAPMTLNRQKAIFQHSEVIARINGAAFANALFRYDKPLMKVFGFRYAGFVVPPVADAIAPRSSYRGTQPTGSSKEYCIAPRKAGAKACHI